jgi:hypothetical protein
MEPYDALRHPERMNVTLGPDALTAYRAGSASWFIGGASSTLAGGSAMVMHPNLPQYGYAQELAHHQDVHAPLPQLATDWSVALLALGVAAVYYAPKFRFCRTLDGSGQVPDDP